MIKSYTEQFVNESTILNTKILFNNYTPLHIAWDVKQNVMNKLEIVKKAVQDLVVLQNELEHPEAVILLSAIRDDENSMHATGVLVGCKHGMELVLYQTAKQNPEFLKAMKKALKKVKYDDDHLLDELFNHINN